MRCSRPVLPFVPVRCRPLLRVLLLAGVALFTASETAAQSEPAIAPGSLGEAVEKTILRHPDVLARYHALRAADAEQDVSRSAYFPSVDLQLYTAQERRKSPLFPNDSYARDGHVVQLRQILFDGLATYSDVKRGGYMRLMRFYELLGTSNTVAYEAARAFTDVQRARLLVQLAYQNWAILKTLTGQIAERAEAGVGKRVDLEQAEGRLALAQSTWLTEMGAQHSAVQRYQWLVGEPPSINPEKVPLPAERLPADNGFLAEAIRNNPNFLATVANIRANHAQKDVRSASLSPTLELRASNSKDRNLSGSIGQTDVSTVQLQLNWNLFRGGADVARIRQAQENIYAAADQRDKICRDIRQQAAVAWHDVHRLREQLRYLESHQNATESARNAYRQQFDIGQRSLLDLLNTENELFESRRAAARARFDLLQAEYLVLMHTQQLLPLLGLVPIVHRPPAGVDTTVPEADGMLTCSPELPPYESMQTYGVGNTGNVTLP